MRRLLNQLIFLVLMGIIIITFLFGIMLLVYLFLFAAAVGVVVYFVGWLRQQFFRKKSPVRTKRTGRIIDSDEWRKL